MSEHRSSGPGAIQCHLTGDAAQLRGLLERCYNDEAGSNPGVWRRPAESSLVRSERVRVVGPRWNGRPRLSWCARRASGSPGLLVPRGQGPGRPRATGPFFVRSTRLRADEPARTEPSFHRKPGRLVVLRAWPGKWWDASRVTWTHGARIGPGRTSTWPSHGSGQAAAEAAEVAPPPLPKLPSGPSVVKERRTAACCGTRSLPSQLVGPRGPSHLHRALQVRGRSEPSLLRSSGLDADRVACATPATHRLGYGFTLGSSCWCRLACQRWRSKGSPVCMTLRSSGTSLRAIEHTACVPRLPLRALSAR